MEEEEEEGTEGFMKILKCQLATVSKRLHSSEKSLHTAANEEKILHNARTRAHAHTHTFVFILQPAPFQSCSRSLKISKIRPSDSMTLPGVWC